VSYSRKRSAFVAVNQVTMKIPERVAREWSGNSQRVHVDNQGERTYMSRSFSIRQNHPTMATLDVILKEKIAIKNWRLSRYWGWQSMILPQMGESVLAVDFQESHYSQHNIQAMEKTIDSYICPSSSVVGEIEHSQLARRMENAGQEDSSHFGMTSYRGVRGFWKDVYTGTADADVEDEESAEFVFFSGMFENNLSNRFRDVSDGESYTLMLGESSIGFWGDGFSCCATINDSRPDFYSYYEYNPGQDAVADAVENPFFRSQFMGFGGEHDGVSNFALVDGSARSISTNVDGQVLRAIVTRNNNEIVELPD